MSQKEQIAEAFEHRVGRFGYAKTTLDEIARELHISKKTIYVHFEGKREIYEYIVQRQANIERLRMKAAVSQLPTCREKAKALTRLIISSARAHIAETSEVEWLQEYEVAADAFKKAYGELLRELVADGIETEEFAAGDALLVEKMVAAMLVEYLVAVNADFAYDRDEELIERIIRFVG